MVSGDLTADMKVRAAWLYFVEGLTQEQIAQTLKVPRLRINRLLAQARGDGTVSITIQARSAGQVALERCLTEALGLDTAIVVPASAKGGDPATLVGYAAGRWLSEEMHDGTTLAVGWGHTLSLALRGMTAKAYQGASVVSLMGSMTHSRAVNPSAVARRVADMFHADCFQLTAPIFVSRPAMRDALFAEPGLQDLRARASKADLALISVGTLTPDATLVREGLVSIEDITSLARAGAIADVVCHFIDANGREVSHPLNRRAMALDLETVRRIPRVAIISGGAGKAKAIRAGILATGARVLITDVTAAETLLTRGGR